MSPDETVVEDQVVEEPMQESGAVAEASAPEQDSNIVADAEGPEAEPDAAELGLAVPEPDDAPVLSDHDAALRDHKACAAENRVAKEARKRAADNREAESEPEAESEAEDESE